MKKKRSKRPSRAAVQTGADVVGALIAQVRDLAAEIFHLRIVVTALHNELTIHRNAPGRFQMLCRPYAERPNGRVDG